jgi:hypothetical protein
MILRCDGMMRKYDLAAPKGNGGGVDGLQYESPTGQALPEPALILISDPSVPWRQQCRTPKFTP